MSGRTRRSSAPRGSVKGPHAPAEDDGRQPEKKPRPLRPSSSARQPSRLRSVLGLPPAPPSALPPSQAFRSSPSAPSAPPTNPKTYTPSQAVPAAFSLLRGPSSSSFAPPVPPAPVPDAPGFWAGLQARLLGRTGTTHRQGEASTQTTQTQTQDELSQQGEGKGRAHVKESRTRTETRAPKNDSAKPPPQVSSTILRPRPSTRATRVPPAVDPEEKPIAGEGREKGRGLRSRGPITTVDQVEGQEGTAGLGMRDEKKRRAKGQAGGRSDGANRQKEEQQGGRKGEGREQADKDSGQGRSNEEPSGKASRASKACVGSGDTHVLPKAVEGVEVERRRGRKRKDTTVCVPPSPPAAIGAATVLIVGKRSKLRRRRRQSDDSDVEDDDYLIEDDEERRTHIQARRDRQREEQWQRMATHDVTTAFRAVREQFKQRFTREHYVNGDFVLIADEPGCPNAAFAGLCARSPDLHTTLVLHGTKVALAKRILRRGFDPTRIQSGGDEGSRESVFYFGTDPGIVDRWRKGDEVEGGQVWAHCVVSILLWDPKAAIRLSGCTGGTIKVPGRAHSLIQPLFRFKYRSPWRPHSHTFQIAALCSKNHLEDPVLETDTWERVSAASGIKDPRELLPSHIDRFLLPYPTKPSISSLAQDFR